MQFSRRDIFGLIGGGGAFVAGLASNPLAADIPLAGSVRERVMAMVDEAALAVNQFGFPRALNRTDWQVWRRPDLGLYVFVVDKDGMLLLHPDRRGEGQNVIASVDTQGIRFINNMIKAATAAHGQGVWTRYQWTDARSGEPGTKHTYSKAARDVIVSVGYVAAIS